ncbi:MAG: aldose 1-epimerase [Clostridia bacterium]|nr:aldose 1-epimerase [Clostridia bacterium]
MIDTDIQLTGGGYIADISSRLGGICYRLVHSVTGADLLRTPKDEAHLLENVYLFGNPPLFPPNRILGGRFVFEGKEYLLPLNEPSTGCHIHGALYKMPFVIEKLEESRVRLVFEEKAGEYICFPHAFLFVREYLLDENGLLERDTVTNLSPSVMPFMLAYHTTFNIPFINGSAPWEHRIRLDTGREELRTEKFIPTGEFRDVGEREEKFRCGEYVPFGEHLSAFYEASGEMVMRDVNSGVELFYDADREAFPYRMLFQTVEGSFFVCEPQTTAIDCFHLPPAKGDYGLVRISPGEQKTYWTRMGVR